MPTKQAIELYSLATPNGQKVSVMLEEIQIPYNAHTINILEGDQFTDEYKKISPNSKIPAIIDPNGPDGKELSIMESGAILIYLSEKSGKLLSNDPRVRNETLQWLFFQVGHVGPMFGQFGHFYKYWKAACDHPYPVERYTKEAKRLLWVLDTQLAGNNYLINNTYSIADIATFPWVDALTTFYGARETLGLDWYKNVDKWLKTCLKRPAVQRWMNVC